MNIFSFFEVEFQTIINQLVSADLLSGDIDTSRVVFELPRDESHGDLATNAAMVLAKQAGKSPRDLATLFVGELTKIDGVICVDIAGPGFLNLTVEPRLWAREIADIIAANLTYGKSDIGAGDPVNVEFVSANPTGPLHAAHARGAVILSLIHI